MSSPTLSTLYPVSNLFHNMMEQESRDIEQYLLTPSIVNDRMMTIIGLLKAELGDNSNNESYSNFDRLFTLINELAGGSEDDAPITLDPVNGEITSDYFPYPLVYYEEITDELWEEICRKQDEATGVCPKLTGINFDYGATSHFVVPIHGPAVVMKFDKAMEYLLRHFLISHEELLQSENYPESGNYHYQSDSSMESDGSDEFEQ